MSTKRLLIIGQGDIGLPVTNHLAQAGFCVTGLARRTRQHYDVLDTADFLQADALTLTVEQLQPFTHIAIIVTPDEYSTSGYHDSYLAINQHLATLAMQLANLERVVFISSTGVYGQDGGEWVDEQTAPMTPARDASKIRLRILRLSSPQMSTRPVAIMTAIWRLISIWQRLRRSLPILSAWYLFPQLASMDRIAASGSMNRQCP